jgi:hypothetical protein
MMELLRLGTPILMQVGPMTYGELLGMFDAQIVSGRHYALETRSLAELTPAVISELVAGIGAGTSPFSIIVLHHFHGAAARVSSNATAFSMRREHFLLEIIAAWEPTPEDTGTRHRQWAAELSRVVGVNALPGGYPNLLSPTARDQIQYAHGDNIGRLRDVKGSYDPANVFSAIPLAI